MTTSTTRARFSGAVIAAAACGAVMSASPAPAVAANCAQLSVGVDACLAMKGCAWNAPSKRCLPRREAMKLTKAYLFEPGQPNTLQQISGRQLKPIQKSAFNEFGLGRECPDAMLAFLQKHDISPTVVNIPPVSRWLVWDDNAFKPGAPLLQQKVDLVAAYQSMRQDGQCMRNLPKLTDESNPKLRLHETAVHNWNIAEPGNVMMGVIDCENWNIHLLPQPRVMPGAEQKTWIPEQLARVQWTREQQTLGDPKLPREVFRLVSQPTLNNSHGLSASFVMGWDERPEATLGEQCAFDRKVRANFMGFTLFKKLKSDSKGEAGDPILKFSSRQLNGANNPSISISPDGKNVMETVPGAGKSTIQRAVYNANGAIADTSIHNSDTVGMLPAPLRNALQEAISKLP